MNKIRLENKNREIVIPINEYNSREDHSDSFITIMVVVPEAERKDGDFEISYSHVTDSASSQEMDNWDLNAVFISKEELDQLITYLQLLRSLV